MIATQRIVDIEFMQSLAMVFRKRSLIQPLHQTVCELVRNCRNPESLCAAPPCSEHLLAAKPQPAVVTVICRAIGLHNRGLCSRLRYEPEGPARDLMIDNLEQTCLRTACYLVY